MQNEQFKTTEHDGVEMDGIELLILALERAGVVPSEMVVPLHINYLRETLNGRPVP